MPQTDSIWQRDIVPTRWKALEFRMRYWRWAIFELLLVTCFCYSFFADPSMLNALLVLVFGLPLGGRERDGLKYVGARHLAA